jgi:hypothetical protein
MDEQVRFLPVSNETEKHLSLIALSLKNKERCRKDEILRVERLVKQGSCWFKSNSANWWIAQNLTLILPVTLSFQHRKEP